MFPIQGTLHFVTRQILTILFFSVLKETVAASKPYTVAGRLKTETLDSRSRKRMCKENEALKDFQNMIPEAM